jgi:sulfite reductase (ferredoxin)
MVRVRIPDGRLTASQYLALDALADRHANGSLRITTRQSIQCHGVVEAGLKLA